MNLFYDYPVLNALWSFSLAEESELFRKEREPGKECPEEGRLKEELLKEGKTDPARKKLLSRLRKDPEAYEQFLDLPPRLQGEFLSFCTGQKGVKITYDPFFKFVFNPELHPERLERLLSELLKERVKIRQLLPPESIRFHEGMSLVVMDILVELASGALCDVEIQKAPYAFPGQRAACYSSELVVRQYSRARRRTAAEKTPFSYRQLSRVYTIVILEKSSGEFCRYSDHYVHRASQVFDTGLSLNLLQEYIFISLDIFHNIVHEIKEELDAWLMFLSSDEPADIARIIAAFPEFAEYYRDIAGFREKPEELISMFSRILAEMDRDEYFCMMEDLKEDNRKLSEQARGLEDRNQNLEDENQNLENRLNSLMEQRDRMAVRYYQETGNAEEIAGLLGMSKEELQAVLGTGEEG
ncbi:MAG TPA: PD-(D/E)XK nuclease family transposase [Candidatus Eisenbergiella merdavium]|uniref:PD-(D/E)XK nuclease family transposase n=1 Tax=Candidatus Eisenbergiella merdavium TaxID=2838551 RepID=A0A9D2NF88_9FIRM|nr:PD-(D/E)XK nuclease family transposase [Candidatus Eisenbergiella merdavium]